MVNLFEGGDPGNKLFENEMWRREIKGILQFFLKAFVKSSNAVTDYYVYMYMHLIFWLN